MYQRPILKRELAQLYYPDKTAVQALRLFRAEIAETKGLLEALKAQKYAPGKNNQYFSPAQIKVIFKYLDRPT